MKIKDEVLANIALAEFDALHGNLVRFPEMPDNQYRDLMSILKKAGGRWDGRKAVQAIDFGAGNSAKEILQRLLETGDSAQANPLAFYGTPDEIGDILMERVRKLKTESGLAVEPSVGEGALIAALTRADVRVDEINAVEIDKVRAEKAWVKLLDANDKWRCPIQLHQMDFLQWSMTQHADLIVANFPFSVPSDKNVWVHHFRRAYDLLANGGVMACIVSNGLTFRTDLGIPTLRRQVEMNGEIVELPDNLFKGTGTRTVLAVMIRNEPAKPLPPYVLTATAKVSRFGYGEHALNLTAVATPVPTPDTLLGWRVRATQVFGGTSVWMAIAPSGLRYSLRARDREGALAELEHLVTSAAPVNVFDLPKTQPKDEMDQLLA